MDQSAQSDRARFCTARRSCVSQALWSMCSPLPRQRRGEFHLPDNLLFWKNFPSTGKSVLFGPLSSEKSGLTRGFLLIGALHPPRLYLRVNST